MRVTQIKLRRLERGLVQAIVAQRTGINRGRLSEIECGYVEPRPDELARIAGALELPVLALVEAHNPPPVAA